MKEDTVKTISLGVAAAGIGGLAYWLLTREAEAQECTPGESKCVGEDLWSCIEGKWSITASAPECAIVVPAVEATISWD